MIRKCVWNASTNRPLRFPRPVRTGNDAQLTMQQEIVREIFLSERFTFYGRSNGHVCREDNWGLTSRVKTSGSIFLFDSPFFFFIFKIYIYIIERFLVYFWSSASNIHRRFRSIIWKIFQRWINRLFFFFENKFENKIEGCWEELRCAQSKRNLFCWANLLSYLINELRSIRVRISINRFVRFRIMMGKMLRIKCEQMQQISWTDSRKSQIWYSNIFRFKRAFDFEKTELRRE